MPNGQAAASFNKSMERTGPAPQAACQRCGFDGRPGTSSPWEITFAKFRYSCGGKLAVLRELSNWGRRTNGKRSVLASTFEGELGNEGN